EAATSIIQDAYDGRTTSAETLDNAEHRVFQVAQLKRAEEFVRLKELIWPTMERIEHLHTSQGALTGAATEFTDLDRPTPGCQRADLDRRLRHANTTRHALQAAPAPGRARHRHGGRRLSPDDAGSHRLGEPPAGDLVHLPLPQGPRQGAGRAGARPVAAVPRAGAARGWASAA